jgi:hypothetical protein
MKKLALTSVCALAVTGAALAQGTVNWQSFIPTGIKISTNSTSYSPLFGGGANAGGASGFTAPGANGFYYELLYQGGAQTTAPTSLAALFTWIDASPNGNNTLEATSGGSAGTVAPITPNAGAAVPWAAGTTDNIVLVGWSANMGTTWLACSNVLASSTFAANSFFGISTSGYLAAAASSPGTTLWGTSASPQGLPINASNMQLYLLPPVPEPTTLALAGLGGLSLLLFRRQRK